MVCAVVGIPALMIGAILASINTEFQLYYPNQNSFPTIMMMILLCTLSLGALIFL